MKQTGFKKKPPKERKCKFCEDKFLPTKQLMPFCRPMCERLYKEMQPKKEREKKARLELKEFNNQDVKKRTKDAKKAVQEYVRLRDINESCISCQKPTAKQWDGGHYMSAEYYSSVRFNTLNIHKQCSHCNDWNNENKAEYRIHLIKKIGLEKVEWLESQKQVTKYSADYLNRFIKIYRKRVRILKARLKNK